MQGYRVLGAASGAAALDSLDRDPSISLLVTDVVMPGMDGFELANLAKQRRPSLRVLYVSGYLKEIPWGQHGIGHGRLLSKPWRSADLKREVGAAVRA